jgi:ABC-type multidrug transport system fused ATPase/permease subunit
LDDLLFGKSSSGSDGAVTGAADVVESFGPVTVVSAATTAAAAAAGVPAAAAAAAAVPGGVVGESGDVSGGVSDELLPTLGPWSQCANLFSPGFTAPASSKSKGGIGSGGSSSAASKAAAAGAGVSLLNLDSWPGLVLAAFSVVVLVEALIVGPLASSAPSPSTSSSSSSSWHVSSLGGGSRALRFPSFQPRQHLLSLNQQQLKTKHKRQRQRQQHAAAVVMGHISPEECLEAAATGFTPALLLPLALGEETITSFAANPTAAAAAASLSPSTNPVKGRTSHVTPLAAAGRAAAVRAASALHLGRLLRLLAYALSFTLNMLKKASVNGWRAVLLLTVGSANAATLVLASHAIATILLLPGLSTAPGTVASASASAAGAAAAGASISSSPSGLLDLTSAVRFSGAVLCLALTATSAHASFLSASTAFKRVHSTSPAVKDVLGLERKDKAIAQAMHTLTENVNRDAVKLAAAGAKAAPAPTPTPPAAGASAAAAELADEESVVVVPRGPHPSDGLRLKNVWVASPDQQEQEQEHARHFAVKGVSLHVPGGTVAVVVGGVGSGKSSLISALASGGDAQEGGGVGTARMLQGDVLLQGEAWSADWGAASSDSSSRSSSGCGSSGSGSRSTRRWGTTRQASADDSGDGRWWSLCAWGGWKAGLGVLRQRPAMLGGGLSLADSIAVGVSPALLLHPPPPPPSSAIATPSSTSTTASTTSFNEQRDLVVLSSLVLAGAESIAQVLPAGLDTILLAPTSRSDRSSSSDKSAGGNYDDSDAHGHDGGRGVGGVALSAGEWAAVALARSLAGLVAGTASLVLLDEPESMVVAAAALESAEGGGGGGNGNGNGDASGGEGVGSGVGGGGAEVAQEAAEVALMERLVAAASERPHCAVLVATRRPRLALFAEHVVVLGPQGQVLEQGHPEVLLTESPGGAFAQLLGANSGANYNNEASNPTTSSSF